MLCFYQAFNSTQIKVMNIRRSDTVDSCKARGTSDINFLAFSRASWTRHGHYSDKSDLILYPGHVPVSGAGGVPSSLCGSDGLHLPHDKPNHVCIIGLQQHLNRFITNWKTC